MLPVLANSLCLTALCLSIRAIGVKPLNELPGYLAFGAAVGAALTFIS